MFMPSCPRHYQGPSLVPSTPCLPVSTQLARRHRLCCTSSRNPLADAAATVFVTSFCARPLIQKRAKRVVISHAKPEDKVENVGRAQQKLGEAQQELKMAEAKLEVAQQKLEVTRKAVEDALVGGSTALVERKEAVTDAKRAVADAKRAVADARKLRDYWLNTARTAVEVMHQPDICCKWLQEVVTNDAGPDRWAADSVVKFVHNILGDETMGNNMVVRSCYKRLDELIIKWLKPGGNLRRTGVCVVTGTPGIGKSVFQGYMAAKLARDTSIVIQRGKEWWSWKPRAAPRYHAETKPIHYLGDPELVLLADPLGNTSRVSIDWRSRGCTIIFTSPHHDNYGTVWSQAKDKVQFIMTRWTKSEVIQHRSFVLPLFQTNADVEHAYALLGGSLRWLYTLSKCAAPLDDAAQGLTDNYLQKPTYEQLLEVAGATACKIDFGNSTLSYFLQIETDENCEKVFLRLPDSDVTLTVMSARLQKSANRSRASFIKAALNIPLLGTLVGRLFQSEVLDGLCGKGQSCRKLQLRQLGATENVSMVEDAEVIVPNVKEEVQVRSASSVERQLYPKRLYNPLSDIFAAADMFFIIGTNLWLLQVTKHEKHDCKMGALQEAVLGIFTQASLNKITDISWVVVVPSCCIASRYTKVQKVIGQWNVSGNTVSIKQYVCSWQD